MVDANLKCFKVWYFSGDGKSQIEHVYADSYYIEMNGAITFQVNDQNTLSLSNFSRVELD